MDTIPRAKLHRIPGGVMPIAQKEVQIKDITKLTHLELMEIRDRESKLLANKAKMQKLPDKGKRIQDFYDKVIKELERRSNVDEAAQLFSALNIASTGEKTLNDLEWRGRLKADGNDETDPLEDVMDSDDEIEMDPLRIIAQRQMHERKVKIEKEEPKLITDEDLKDIESFKIDSPDSGVNTESGTGEGANTNPAIDAEIMAIDIKDKLDSLKPKLLALNSSHNESRTSSSCSNNLELDPHVHYLVEKTELQVQPQREKFKPYQTTVSNVHDPAKERARKQHKNWENTAATPPAIKHKSAQLVTLMDSVEIQTEYLVKLKELQEKQAADRLAAKIKRLEERKLQLPPEDILKSKPSFTNYRSKSPVSKTSHTHLIEGEQQFNEDDEVHDPLDEEKASGVNYTVYD